MSARENPFATEHTERLPFRFPPGMDWEKLLQKLQENEWTGAIVGVHGSGKTTALEQLATQLEACGFQPILFRLQAESGIAEKDRLLAEAKLLRTPQFLLLDGAEQLTTRQWLPLRGAVSKAAGFVITLHREGRLPTLLECKTTPDLLEELVADLTDGRLPAGEATALLHRAHGNLRQCFSELYDRWAGE